MFNRKTRKIISSIIVIIVVLAMILPAAIFYHIIPVRAILR